ncbi:MAG: class I SAM-dependent methyltransferase [Bacteroidetes bacterium]|nr:class I SAM-dependent methyltransferase [Bacteroidota bacterium]
MKLLEIGCGNSVLITYLAQQFGFEVTRLDYSEKGCQQSRLILEREKVKGNIICQDAFNPSPDLLNQFDVVCSFGVVEHFSDTSGTIKAFSNFLKPGGLLVTSLPNMSSVTGNLHKYLNRPVYDIHVPLDKNQIETAIEKAGLKLKFSSYFLAISFAITLEGLNGEKIKNYSLKRFFIKTLRYGSKLIWMVENKLGTIPPGKIFSGGIITSAQK